MIERGGTEGRPLLVTRWASQSARAAPALAPEQMLLDGRGIAELLAEAMHLSGWIGFQETDNLIAGDWRRILAADPAMALALLATIDVDARSEWLRTLIDSAFEERDAEQADTLVRDLTAALLGFAGEIDDWLAPVEDTASFDMGTAQGLVVRSVEDVLRPQLRGVLLELAAAEDAGILSGIVAAQGGWGLRDHWQLEAIAVEARDLRRRWEGPWRRQLLERMVDVAGTFIRELRMITERAEVALATSLNARNHPPHVALVFAFTRVFRHAQAKLNAAPGRLVDFFQYDILRTSPSPARPDQVLVAVVPRPGAHPFLPRGTITPASSDSGSTPVAFATDKALAITGAELARIRCLREIAINDAGSRRMVAVEFTAGPYGQVGDPVGGVARGGTVVPIAPSIVVASAALGAMGVRRHITLTLACDGLVPDLGAEQWAGAIGLALSTETGWFGLPAAGAKVTWIQDDDIIVATIELDDTVPRAVPTGDIHGPALEIAFRSDQSDGVVAFAGVKLSRVMVSVVVGELVDVVASVSGEPASVASAAPFGDPPRAGGTLRLDHPLFESGTLDRLVLAVEWEGLPRDPAGFAGHYRDYVVDAQDVPHDRSPLSNASFTAHLTAPVPGHDATLARPLFATVPPDGSVAAAPDILSTTPLRQHPPPDPAGMLAPTSWFVAERQAGADAATARYLELALAGPTVGFGDTIYRANVTHATTLMTDAVLAERPLGWFVGGVAAIGAATVWLGARLMDAVRWLGRGAVRVAGWPMRLLGRLEGLDDEEAAFETDAEPLGPSLPAPTGQLPKPPYRPLTAAIRVDVACQLDDRDAGLRLYHRGSLTPMAPQPVVLPLRPFDVAGDAPLIEIGLAGAQAGQRLSLLVTVGAAPADTGFAIGYDYLAATGWRPLSAEIEDGTGGLQASGLLTLTLPDDAVTLAGHGELLWIRARIGEGTIPPVTAILLDAVSATRLDVEAAATMTPIPPGRIQTIPGIAGVAQVVQPLASAGGRPPQDQAMLRNQIGERVRHRARAIEGWDYERLILDSFPEVALAKAVPSAADDPPGSVTVAIVPAAAIAQPLPARSGAQLRLAIERRLQEVSSPFAQIRVVEPVYTLVDVDGEIVVRSSDGFNAEALVERLLSPFSERGLALDDDASAEGIRAALAAALLRQSDVVRIERLSVRLRTPAQPSAWSVPRAGELRITMIAAERAFS